MTSFLFWQRRLVAVGAAVSVFGVMMALLIGRPFFDLFNRQIDPAFWGANAVDSAIKQFQQWIYGVWGATIAGWGIILTCGARYPFSKKERWFWNYMVCSRYSAVFILQGLFQCRLQYGSAHPGRVTGSICKKTVCLIIRTPKLRLTLTAAKCLVVRDRLQMSNAGEQWVAAYVAALCSMVSRLCRAFGQGVKKDEVSNRMSKL
jgi:hypothetical protein